MNKQKEIAKMYDSLPPESKVQMLENAMKVALRTLADIDLNIQKFGLMKKGSLAYENFYQGYNQLVGKKVEK